MTATEDVAFVDTVLLAEVAMVTTTSHTPAVVEMATATIKVVAIIMDTALVVKSHVRVSVCMQF